MASPSTPLAAPHVAGAPAARRVAGPRLGRGARITGRLMCGLLSLAAACAGCSDPRPRAAAARPEPVPKPGAAPAREPTPHAAPLELELRPEPAADGFALVLLQRGTEPARLDTTLGLERRGADGWQAVAGVELALRHDCTDAPPSCLTLVPGAELRPPAWPARLGDAQCGCKACAPAPAGEYRFVVRGCDGGSRLSSASFQLP